MPLIKNARYKQFLKTGFIETLDRSVFDKLLARVEHPKDKQQARALMILLYITGRRPSEILELRGGSVIKARNHLKLQIKTLKGGRFTTLFLPLSNPLIQEFWAYAKNKFETFYLFHSFRSTKAKTVTWKKQGETKSKRFVELSANLYYWIEKWTGLPPYFLRHNRFSTMSEQGATDGDIMLAKGASSIESVRPYIHMSKKRAQKLAKFYK